MTVHENARFTCDRLVQEYVNNGSFKDENKFWETLAIIKNSLTINAISMEDAKRYCYHLHVTFEQMMTA